MPRIPTYVPRAGVPSVELPNIPTDAASAVPNAMAKAGAALFSEGVKWEDQIARAQQAAQLSSSVANASVALHDLRNSILTSGEYNTDPGASRKTWDSKVQELGQTLAGQMNDARARQMFQDHYEKLAASHTASLSDDVRKKQVEIVRGSGLSALETLSRSAAQSQNENTFSELEKNAHMTVSGMIASGAVGYDDGQRLWEHWKKQTGSGRAHLELQLNPDKVLRDLQSGSKAYSSLDPVTLAQISDAAQRRKDTLFHKDIVENDKLERKIEKQLRDEQEQTEMDLFSRLDDPYISMMLEDARQKRTIRPDAYKSLLRAIWSEEGVSNPSVELAIEDQVYGIGRNGNADEVRITILNNAGQPGGISRKRAGELLGKVRDIQKADDISHTPQYHEGLSFLEQSIKTSGPGASILDPDEQARLAMGKREFDERVRKGEDARTVSEDVSDRYRSKPLSPSAYPRPQKLNGPVNDQAALDAAEKATVDAFKDDQMDRATFMREIENLKRIRQAIIRRDEAMKQFAPTGTSGRK